jgi:hypothetical protein
MSAVAAGCLRDLRWEQDCSRTSQRRHFGGEKVVRSVLKSRAHSASGKAIAFAIFGAVAFFSASCKKRVPDEAWSRRVFYAKEHEINDLVFAINDARIAMNGALAAKPAAAAEECAVFQRKALAELARHPSVIEWEVEVGAPGSADDPPCNLPGRASAPREDEGEVPAEKGIRVEMWQIGRRLTTNRRRPAIEVFAGQPRQPKLYHFSVRLIVIE